MPSFTDDPRFSRIANDASYKGWTVSTLPLGGWLGALINGYLLGKAGRRWAICGASAVCLLGAILTTAAMAPSYIFSGRFFIGMTAQIDWFHALCLSPNLRYGSRNDVYGRPYVRV